MTESPPAPLLLIGLTPAHPHTHRVAPGQPATLGRAMECEIVLTDETVSRRHATVSCHGGQWYVQPHSTRSPTKLNGVTLPAGQPSSLRTGDVLHIGPVLFRASAGSDHSRPLATIDDAGASASAGRIERVGAEPASRGPGSVSDQRLRVLVTTLEKLAQAGEPEALAKLVADSAAAGSGYARAAVLRRLDAVGQVALVAASGEAGDLSAMRFSRSLLTQAATGQTAIMTSASREMAPQHSQSIAELNIHSALCAPIQVAGALVGFLYLDARGRESAVRRDAAGFCEALATAYAFALGESSRAELQRRQSELAIELSAAREVQQLILPPEGGVTGPARFAVRINPGLFVAGDFFDVFELPGGRTAICMGDVAGHGVGPALLMSATLSYLHADLLRHGDPVQAVNAVNRFAAPRFSGGRFASAFVAVLEPDGRLTFVDAGHGHWMLRSGSGAPHRPPLRGHIPIGIDAEYDYAEATVMLGPGDRLVLYSDGVIEQRSPSGEPFGRERLIECLASTADPDADVEAIFRGLAKFSGSPRLDDDATAASITLDR